MIASCTFKTNLSKLPQLLSWEINMIKGYLCSNIFFNLPIHKTLFNHVNFYFKKCVSFRTLFNFRRLFIFIRQLFVSSLSLFHFLP